MFYRIILIAFLAFATDYSYGQNLDSLMVERLLKQANEQKEDSEILAHSLVNKAEEIATKKTLIDLKAVCYYTKGVIYEEYEKYDSAEYWLLKWLAIREEQGAPKERWALKGLQGFYTRRKNVEKLDSINYMYLKSLNDEYCKLTSECDFKYGVGVRIMTSQMVDLGGYKQAESYFLQSLSVGNEDTDWFSSDLVYFQIEEALAEKGDSLQLNEWYKRWFETIDKQPDSKKKLIKTVNILIGKRRWNSEYMKPSIALLETAYPFLSDNGMKELLLKQFKDFKSAYLKMSAGYLVYLTIKVQESMEPSTKEKKKKFKELFNKVGQKTKSIDEFSRTEVVYVLKSYGITSPSEVIRESSKKLLKKIQ